jgi:hypothetical protein
MIHRPRWYRKTGKQVSAWSNVIFVNSCPDVHQADTPIGFAKGMVVRMIVNEVATFIVWMFQVQLWVTISCPWLRARLLACVGAGQCPRLRASMLAWVGAGHCSVSFHEQAESHQEIHLWWAFLRWAVAWSMSFQKLFFFNTNGEIHCKEKQNKTSSGGPRNYFSLCT